MSCVDVLNELENCVGLINWLIFVDIYLYMCVWIWMQIGELMGGMCICNLHE